MTNTNNTPGNESPETDLPDGMYGYVSTDDSGAIIEKKGKIVRSFDEYVAYFNQLSDLAADSLGFDRAEEMLLLGARHNAICFAADGIHYGAVFKIKADRNAITEYLREKGESDEFGADF
ncbi:MAG: hypothetical protein AAF065_08225 [Verrucomicrobiota bacterium]